MSNLVYKATTLQVITCLNTLLDRANHDEYIARIGKKEALKFLEENGKYADIIKSALQRLEAIDNSNPSEALKFVEEWKYQINSYIDCSLDCGDIDNECYNHLMDELEQYYITIKQALIKAQEPKHYLKWEDLEFDRKEAKYMKVSLNGTKYCLVLTWGFCEPKMVKVKPINIYEEKETEGETIFLLDGNYINDTQFFNNLHLERVEE